MKRRLRVGHRQQRLEPPQHPVACASPWPARRRRAAGCPGAPRACASKRANSVNASAAAPAKPGDHAVVVQLAHLARARLHDGLAERDLPVARHRHLAPVPDADHGGGVDRRGGRASVIATLRRLSGRPRMRGVVHPHQLLRAHVGVALGRGEAAVAQQLLDEAEVGARVRAGGWRRCGAACAGSPAGRCRPRGRGRARSRSALRVVSRPPRGFEEERPAPPPAEREVGREGLQRGLAERHDRSLRPLPSTRTVRSACGPDRRRRGRSPRRRAARWRRAARGARVARAGHGRLRRRRSRSSVGLVHRQERRQACAAQARAAHLARRIRLHDAAADEEAKAAPHRGQLARDGGRPSSRLCSRAR